ncbi:MAG: inclusion body family protein [Holophagales bacterium]|nr:inclusion body family protein [Holophagales bacterium]
MSQNIDVVVVVDTQRLMADYPYGISDAGNSVVPLDQYFQVLVPRTHRYEDPDYPTNNGIQCKPLDEITFRAQSKANSPVQVLIAGFADKVDTGGSTTVLNYLGYPQFATARLRGGETYDNITTPSVPRARGANWIAWHAALQDADIVDPFMSVRALQDTSDLPNDHIRYALTFRVLRGNGAPPLYYGFDPAIRISDRE